MPRETVADLIGWAERRLAAAGIVCAQGTATCRDEAAAIIYHLLNLEHADASAYRRQVMAGDRARCEAAIRERIEGRVPAAYLLGEAMFAGLRFHVDGRVLIPRSPFAELIAARFAPWFAPPAQPRILDLGTGSGCIAIACALAFPDGRVLATDISADALEVAALNVERHGVEDRVQIVQADIYSGLSGPFDLIVSNPPYVTDADLRHMPPELSHEPRIALAGGADGLDLIRGIVDGGRAYLSAEGLLAIEVGAGMRALEATFPRIPFVWPVLAGGADDIALVAANDLPSENATSGRIARGH